MQHIEKEVTLGVIGGSGIYQMPGLEVRKEHATKTPFGSPSDKIIEAVYRDKTVYFLPRHGRHHSFLPSEVNYRANIYALKSFGVTHVLSVSAVGIMREQIKPGDMIVPDQIFDRTKGIRQSSFFGDGIVGHVGFADPFSSEMQTLIAKSAKNQGATVHEGGAIVVMEGPQFSTRSESCFYREALKPACIGMTALPEAKLAREAELAYGLLAMATDYDCWHESEADVSVEAVVAVLKANASLANNIIKDIIEHLPTTSSDPAFSAAQYAIMTHADAIPKLTRERLDLLYGRYFK